MAYLGRAIIDAFSQMGEETVQDVGNNPVDYMVLVAMAGKAPEAEAFRAPRLKSEYNPNTLSGARMPNRLTDVTRSAFEKNLSNAGWKKSVSKDGKVAIYEKDGAKYVVRDNAKSTGGPTADYYKAGSDKTDLKIRLKKD